MPKQRTSRTQTFSNFAKYMIFCLLRSFFQSGLCSNAKNSWENNKKKFLVCQVSVTTTFKLRHSYNFFLLKLRCIFATGSFYWFLNWSVLILAVFELLWTRWDFADPEKKIFVFIYTHFFLLSRSMKILISTHTHK